MRRLAAIMAFTAIVALPGRLPAHEGHEHKVMGTVTQVHASDVTQIEVKTTKGEVVVLTADGQTRYKQGKAAATLKDVQVGSRIAATVKMEGKTTRASEVVIGEGAAAKPPAEPHKH